MKKLIFLLLICVNGVLYAQHQDHHEKIEALKAQFLTNELNLTPEEARVFWPLYEAYQKQEKEIQKQRIKHFIDKEKLDALTEDEINTQLTQEFARQKQLADLRGNYYEKLKAGIGTRKAALYFNAEVKFRKHLIRQLRERKK